MKKKSFSMLNVCVSLFLGIFIFSACNQNEGGYSDLVTMIPGNAALVVDIDLQSLGENVTSEQFVASSFYDMANRQTDQRFFELICNDSVKTGIEYDNLVGFVVSKDEFGASMHLEDAQVFESMVEELKDSMGWVVNKSVDEGVKFCMVEDSAVLLIWNDERALFLTGTTSAQGLAIFEQELEQSIVSNEDFKTFYKDKKELAVWIDMENYMEFVGDLPQLKKGMAFPIVSDQKEMYEGMYSSYNVEFLDGEVVMSGAMRPLSKAKALSKKYYKEHISKELLSYIPGNSYILMSAALQFSEILEMSSSLPQFADIINDPKSADIVASIDGDIIISISDFASGPLPIPNAVIGLSVKDEAIFDAIVEMDGVQKVEKEGYTALLVQMFQVFVAQKKDLLLISTNEDIITSFVSGKALDENLTNSKHKKSAESTMYSYVNLDIEQYPAAITTLFQNKLGKDMASVNEAVCLEDLTSWYDYGTGENKTVLALKDKDKNSLKAIFEMMDAFLAMSEK